MGESPLEVRGDYLSPQGLATHRNETRQADGQLRFHRRNRSCHPMVDLIESPSLATVFP